jgi:hypothetical protein
MLERNSSLETLSLGSTSLDTAALVCLLAALRDCRYLTDVDLQKAVLYSKHDDTAKHAAQMLCQNRSLVSLNLANTFVGDLGAQTIAQALARNPTCTKVCLANNQIGEVGARALAELLLGQGTCVLATLDLSRNRLGEVGGAALGNALAGSTSLRKLDLSNCALGERALQSVAAGMHLNSTLRSLRLWGNDFRGQLPGHSGDDGPPPTPAARLPLPGSTHASIHSTGNASTASAKSGVGGGSSSGGASAVAELDALLRGRFLHLDVECDLEVYEVDGLLQVARKDVPSFFR